MHWNAAQVLRSECRQPAGRPRDSEPSLWPSSVLPTFSFSPCVLTRIRWQHDQTPKRQGLKQDRKVTSHSLVQPWDRLSQGAGGSINPDLSLSWAEPGPPLHMHAGKMRACREVGESTPCTLSRSSRGLQVPPPTFSGEWPCLPRTAAGGLYSGQPAGTMATAT